jgi:formylglycine-generating enzyme required for sulfatase activity
VASSDNLEVIMNRVTITSVGLAVLVSVSLVTPAFAVVNIDYVSIGNVGNAADPATGSLYGAVGYAYQIAKNETTISQYAEFLNHAAKSDPYALYSTNMSSTGRFSISAGIDRSGSSGNYFYSEVAGSGNKPVTFVNWFDAARFCNWLHNGQGSGSTETGAYTLDGAMSGIYTRNAGASVWIPSENEWYKAAYYDATKGGTGGYWLYPTRSDAMAGNTIGVAHSANYYDGDYVGSGTSSLPSGNGLTDGGAYGANSASFYGTNDQGGNVWEWNDAVVSGTERGVRGGNLGFYDDYLISTFRATAEPSASGNFDVGFRLASVPEPSCLILTLLVSGVLVTRRKR